MCVKSIPMLNNSTISYFPSDQVVRLPIYDALHFKPYTILGQLHPKKCVISIENPLKYLLIPHKKREKRKKGKVVRRCTTCIDMIKWPLILITIVIMDLLLFPCGIDCVCCLLETLTFFQVLTHFRADANRQYNGSNGKFTNQKCQRSHISIDSYFHIWNACIVSIQWHFCLIDLPCRHIYATCDS